MQEFAAKVVNTAEKSSSGGPLARISHQLSTAAADPGMPTALRSVARLVFMPVCAASLRNLFRKQPWWARAKARPHE
jgi:hypothetical protein